MTTSSPSRSFDSIQSNYNAALSRLNELVSNRQILSKSEFDAIHLTYIPQMRQYFAAVGITDDALNKLSVIHITGTKGKGSTCAYSESILRHRGYKTGFYSSPHLIDTRERIRINGSPISQEQFCHYFWPLIDTVANKLPPDVNPPFYFAFLTLMAMQVFISEKVDVAIVEVGIGGRYDNTTVVRNPVVCGISSLGFDHMHVLGNTIEEIAFNKAGIIRGDCVAVTIPHQPSGGADALKEEALKQHCPIFTAPEMVSTEPLEFLTDVQQLNASLAVQLCYFWERRKSMSLQERRDENLSLCSNSVPLQTLDPIPLDRTTLQALKTTKWPGRQQVISCDNNIHFFLDGAHTLESLQKCHDWFIGHATSGSKKILIFNMIGQRDYQLMKTIMDITFDLVIFTPNLAFLNQVNLASIEDSVDRLKAATQKLSMAWTELRQSGDTPCEPIVVVGCLEEAIEKVKSLQSGDATNTSGVQVLVTGSLHLIGAALHVLDPDCI